MIQISTHAVRRYIERIIGFPCYTHNDWRAIARFEKMTGNSADSIEDIIRSDVESRVPATVIAKRSRKIVKGETARFVIEDGEVVTCYGVRQ